MPRGLTEIYYRELLIYIEEKKFIEKNNLPEARRRNTECVRMQIAARAGVVPEKIRE